MNETPSPVRIAPELLTPHALNGLLEEFVSRSGTDYGAVEYSLQVKKAQVLSQILKGSVLIMFDPDTDSCNLVAAEEAAQAPVSPTAEAAPEGDRC